ncbi:MAG: hypothetical protein Q4E57_09750 [Eubacteriales bacterium]|nr:hypothetical protein [Eubacteriales bacterium]
MENEALKKHKNLPGYDPKREERGYDPRTEGYTEDSLKRRLAWAAGTEKFQHRDPTFHLTESFRQNFDIRGKELGGVSAGQGFSENAGASGGLGEAGNAGYGTDYTSMRDVFEPREGQENRLKKFANISFQRGNMAAAIVEGTGKMMLVSTLKRTIGQEHSYNFKERKLFQAMSVHKEIPAHQNALTIVNRGFAESAVGMMVDVLKDARQSLNNLTAIAEGGDSIDKHSGLETLRKEYPFLLTDREDALLKEYAERRSELEAELSGIRGENAGAPVRRDPREELELLKEAEERVLTVKRRKETTRREFLQKLRVLNAQALRAQAEFESPALLELVANVIQGITEAEVPPGEPTGPPEGASGNGGTDAGKGAESAGRPEGESDA